MNYYNEFDKNAAQWLRNLITAGLIPAGDVDTRDIREVNPDDLTGYTQCHFFAGIGGWPLALRLAGWPEDREIWTGSCPCQPFSSAGKQRGTEDERHLWPEFRRLIAECGPATVFGEQVASALGREWLAGVRTDLEGLGYAVGAADLCAAGVGAPHIRQRLYWLADAKRSVGRPCSTDGSDDQRETSKRDESANRFGECSAAGGMAHTQSARSSSGRCGGIFAKSGGCIQTCGLEHAQGDRREQRRAEPIGRGIGGLDNAIQQGLEGYAGNGDDGHESGRIAAHAAGSAPAAGGNFWSDYTIIPCADGKARRIKPGLSPLVNGVSGRVAYVRPGHIQACEALHWYSRVAALKGFGNAIVPQVAAEFILAYMDIMGIKPV